MRIGALLVAGALALQPSSVGSVGYDQVRDLLSSDDAARKCAEQALLEAKDKSLLAAMSDVLYYNIVIRETARAREISALMEKIAGESVGRFTSRSRCHRIRSL